MTAALLLFALLCLAGILLAPPRARGASVAARIGRHEEETTAPVGPYERWEAERKGQELLSQVLTPIEQAQLRDRGYLDVSSPTKPGRVYRVPRRRGLVERREHGVTVARLCVMPDRWIPDTDIVLMHKLLIEADEARYLQLANQHTSIEADPIPA